jgi:hypothetical protein
MIDKHIFSATLDLLGKLSKRKAQMQMYEIKAIQKIYLSKLIEAGSQEDAEQLALSNLDVDDFGEADYSELYLDHIKMVGSKNYKIEITFTANQELTKGELADLESAISLQLEEPKDYDQNDVSYEVKEIAYKIEEVKQ